MRTWRKRSELRLMDPHFGKCEQTGRFANLISPPQQPTSPGIFESIGKEIDEQPWFAGWHSRLSRCARFFERRRSALLRECLVQPPFSKTAFTSLINAEMDHSFFSSRAMANFCDFFPDPRSAALFVSCAVQVLEIFSAGDLQSFFSASNAVAISPAYNLPSVPILFFPPF
jgi:hypothetical protein